MNVFHWLLPWIGPGDAVLTGSAREAHPLKVLSRRFLVVGLGLSLLFHLTLVGVLVIVQVYHTESAVTVRLTPYAPLRIDVIPTASFVTSEEGRGGDGGTPGGEPPPGAGDDIRSVGTPTNLVPAIGEPVPVPDNVVGAQTTLATQEQLQHLDPLLLLTEEKPTDKAGMGGTGGGSSGMGGRGGGSGGSGGGGTGVAGTWRYDTPPNPRRLITCIQPKFLRNVEGTVRLRLLIDEFGTVIEATILESSGRHELDDLALTAVRQSLFNPATFRGHTVKAWITFGYGFKVAKW